MKTKMLFNFPAIVLLICLGVMQSVNAQFVSVTNSTTNGVAHSVFFTSADTGFVAGEAFGKGVIQKTTDGGQNWVNVYTSTTNLEWVYDIFFVNATNGFAVGEFGSILKTTDGGSNWTRQTIAGVTNFTSVHFPNALVGYAAGEGSNPIGPIYKTTDGGNTWTAQVSGATGVVNDIFFPNALTGYAVYNGDVLKTVNGGSAWTSIPVASTYEHTSIFCTSATTCYLGGPILQKTTDGGSTWNVLSLPALPGPNIYFITSLYFTDVLTGYAVGAIYDTTTSLANGVILKTKDAGQTWSNINTPANNTALQSNPLSAVHFFNSQVGYAAGGGDGTGGVVVRTNNGGTAGCSLNLAVTTTNSACGLATGTASVVATGGAAPYTYAWTNGDKTALADSLHSNLYMVLVTDAGGCTDTKAVLINDASSATITVTSSVDVSCNGGNNGAINILPLGGTLPYTYMWMNGATTKNISNLVAGPYEVAVIDANGCVSMRSILVNEPSKISLTDSIKNATCGSSDGAAVVLASGGIAPYSYLWSTGATTQVLSNIAAGSYSAMVTDSNGCTKSGMGVIVNLGAATATLDSVNPGGCGIGKGSIYISVTGGTAPYTYVWSNGATTEDITGLVPGFYGVTIYSNGNPCTGAFSTNIAASKPASPSICIVTVDTATGKNVCVFEKDSIVNLGLSQYNFYRETTTAGVYQLLGSKPASQLSKWTDNSANPLQRAWRYRITAVDTCGNESAISNFHKTIHLAANIGLNNAINLAWDNYEGFNYGTYVIWRYTTASGWAKLDSVPSNLNAYTDFNPPTPIVNVFYYIEVDNPNGCVVSIKNPDPMTSNLNLSKSNINRINPTVNGVDQMPDIASLVQVYPNPTNGTFSIKNEKLKLKNVEVYNLFGELIFQKAINAKQETLTLSEANGIYFLKITSDEGAVTKKIVVQK